MKNRSTLLLSGIAVLLTCTGLCSALLADLSREDLIRNSRDIVLGTVVEVQSSWTDDHKEIFTFVRLQVHEQLKGQPVGSEIVLQIPGGQVGDDYERVSDTPTFDPGSEVIVHTFMQNTGYLWIYGWKLGVLRIADNRVVEYGMSVVQFRHLVRRLAH